MNFLGYTVSEIRQGLVDTDAMVRVFRDAKARKLVPAEPRLAGDDDHVPRGTPPSVSFENVTASRDGGKTWALKGASFHAPANRTTVLVGASGSGKSTALRLVAQLDAPPTSGAVLVDGQRLADPKAARALASVVAQV